jgi:hypothetical protein
MDLSISAPSWTESRKRKREHEAAKCSTDSPQKNHRGLTIQPEGDRMSEIVLNRLCTICKGIFARAKDSYRRFSWFYDILGLLDSVERGCHFCAQVLRKMRCDVVETLKEELTKVDVKKSDPEPESPLKEDRLKVETRYYQRKGVTFILRHSNGRQSDDLATVDLYFIENSGKVFTRTRISFL